MVMHGTIGEFNPDWTSCTVRLQQYFIANDVEGAEKKCAILLSVYGAATYKFIRSLVHPHKPTDKVLMR